MKFTWILLLGILAGAAIMFAFRNHIAPVLQPPDLKPFRDSIAVLKREKKSLLDSATFYKTRARIPLIVIKQNHQELKHEIQRIENFTANDHLNWLDSTLRSEGYR